MYHSEAFYQYQLGGLLHTFPLTDFELLTNPIFTSRPNLRPSTLLHLPLTVGDGTHSDRTLDSRARDHMKPQNFSATPLRSLYISTSSVPILSCIAIEVQVNMWNKCSRLSLCVDVGAVRGFSGEGGRYMQRKWRDWWGVYWREKTQSQIKRSKNIGWI